MNTNNLTDRIDCLNRVQVYCEDINLLHVLLRSIRNWSVNTFDIYGILYSLQKREIFYDGKKNL